MSENMPWYLHFLCAGWLLIVVLAAVVGCENPEVTPAKYEPNSDSWETTKLRCVAGYEFVTYTRGNGSGITQVLNANGGGVPCSVEREP